LQRPHEPLERRDGQREIQGWLCHVAQEPAQQRLACLAAAAVPCTVSFQRRRARSVQSPHVRRGGTRRPS
jgi:hypothetical protein